MRLDSIALKSILRRRSQALFLVLGVFLALTTVVALYTLSSALNRELADTFDEIGANIMVVPKNSEGFAYSGVAIPLDEGGGGGLTNQDIIAINTIENRENVAFVAPKLLGLVDSPGGRLPVVGVDFPYELKLKKWWTWTGTRPANVDDVLLGVRVAERLRVKPGDRVELGGRPFKVAAILDEQGTEEDGLVFMALLSAQELLRQPGRLSFIEVAAYCTTCPIEEIVRQIQAKLPGARVTALAQAVKARQESVGRFTGFAYAVSAIVVVIGGFLVMLTMMSSVNRRTREIGVYRAIGYRQGHVFEIILTEAALVGLTGGLLGAVAGVAAARTLGPAVFGLGLEIAWSPLVLGVAVLGAVALAVAASILPASQAAKLDPVTAMRFI